MCYRLVFVRYALNRVQPAAQACFGVCNIFVVAYVGLVSLHLDYIFACFLKSSRRQGRFFGINIIFVAHYAER